MFPNLRALWTLMRGERLLYAMAIGAMVVASACLYLAPLFPQIALDGVLTEDPASASAFVRRAVDGLGGRAFLADNLWLLAVSMVGVTVLAGLFTYLRARWAAHASEAITRRLRNRIYDHLQRLPARFFDGAETGDLLQRATSDVETIRGFLSNQVVEIGRALIMVLVPLPLMLMLDWRMTLAATVFVPVIVVYSATFFVRVRRAFTAADEAEAAMTATLQENLTGIRVVRAFSRQEHECERFGEDNETHRARNDELWVLLAWYWSSSDLLTFLQRASVVAVGLFMLATGQLQIGAFFFFLTVTTMFVYPMRMMGRILTDLGKAMVALGRVREILETKTEAQDAANDLAPATLELPARGHVVFDRVTFAHGETTVLDRVSFDLPPGGTLGVVGASGAGKSTLIDLLLRLYDVEGGRITVDGVDVRAVDRQTLRSQLSVVLQQPFLYAKTIAENIGMGRPGAERPAVEASAQLACVHDAIEGFAKGYDTLVGERGVTLSGGQRQRVALARALLKRPAVLVLDDSLSAVDSETETAILDGLRSRKGAHSTIVIAHRLSAVRGADEILVLEEGRVAERGTHESLVRAGGRYARLWQMQTEGSPEDDSGSNANPHRTPRASAS